MTIGEQFCIATISICRTIWFLVVVIVAVWCACRSQSSLYDSNGFFIKAIFTIQFHFVSFQFAIVHQNDNVYLCLCVYVCTVHTEAQLNENIQLYVHINWHFFFLLYLFKIIIVILFEPLTFVLLRQKCKYMLSKKYWGIFYGHFLPNIHTALIYNYTHK